MRANSRRPPRAPNRSRSTPLSRKEHRGGIPCRGPYCSDGDGTRRPRRSLRGGGSRGLSRCRPSRLSDRRRRDPPCGAGTWDSSRQAPPRPERLEPLLRRPRRGAPHGADHRRRGESLRERLVRRSSPLPRRPRIRPRHRTAASPPSSGARAERSGRSQAPRNDLGQESTYYVAAMATCGVITSCYANIATAITNQREAGLLRRTNGTPAPPSAAPLEGFTKGQQMAFLVASRRTHIARAALRPGPRSIRKLQEVPKFWLEHTAGRSQSTSVEARCLERAPYWSSRRRLPFGAPRGDSTLRPEPLKGGLHSMP